jgi:hypothetical protein
LQMSRNVISDVSLTMPITVNLPLVDGEECMANDRAHLFLPPFPLFETNRSSCQAEHKTQAPNSRCMGKTQSDFCSEAISFH